MADVKISQLPASTTPLAGTELVPIVQSGVTKQSTVNQFAAVAQIYTPAGTGAVATTVQTKLRESVSVKDFGAVGDGIADDTAAIQAAINTGFNLIFPAGTYKANNLTQSTTSQRFYAYGQVNISKNANGPLFTGSGNYVEFDGIQFVGTGYTGDNVVLSGNHPRLVNCASYGTPGRALKATGAHVEIIGTCGVYATTDATATGYDIEIGVSGTATLYHQLIGVYTSQAAGGILLIDTGSQSIIGGQFGKLTIQAGTKPIGSNGGMIANARILGNVSVGLSNSTFVGNQFSTQTITFELGSSAHSLNESNITATATIVNNGNSNSSIIKSIGTGSPVGIQLQYGPDAFNSTVRYSNDEIYFEDCNLNLANAKALKFADSGGTLQNGITLSSGDDWTIGANNGANFTNVLSGTAGVFAVVGGTTIAQFYSGGLRPQTDNTLNLGTAAQRWATVYAGTGTINTSDAREKQQVRSLSEAEKAVAVRLKSLIKAFKFNDAVQAKGDAARIHVGVVAQEVVAAFEDEGLDANRYAIICYDEWGAEPEMTAPVLNDDGKETSEIKVIRSAKPAGNRYGVRYEELLAFIISAL